MVAQGCRAVSALSSRYCCDDTAVVAITISCEVRGSCQGARVEFTEFCSSPVNIRISGSCKPGCGGQSDGPMPFSKPAGWPTPDGRPRPPSRQSSGPTSPGRWDMSLAAPSSPPGRGQTWSWALAARAYTSAPGPHPRAWTGGAQTRVALS